MLHKKLYDLAIENQDYKYLKEENIKLFRKIAENIFQDGWNYKKIDNLLAKISTPKVINNLEINEENPLYKAIIYFRPALIKLLVTLRDHLEYSTLRDLITIAMKKSISLSTCKAIIDNDIQDADMQVKLHQVIYEFQFEHLIKRINELEGKVKEQDIIISTLGKEIEIIKSEKKQSCLSI